MLLQEGGTRAGGVRRGRATRWGARCIEENWTSPYLTLDTKKFVIGWQLWLVQLNERLSPFVNPWPPCSFPPRRRSNPSPASETRRSNIATTRPRAQGLFFLPPALSSWLPYPPSHPRLNLSKCCDECGVGCCGRGEVQVQIHPRPDETAESGSHQCLVRSRHSPGTYVSSFNRRAV